MQPKRGEWLVVALLLVSTGAALAQFSQPKSEPNTPARSDTLPDFLNQSSRPLISEDTPNYFHNSQASLPKHLFHDQIGMWSSPSKLKLSDATWLVPLGGFAAALFATDRTVSRNLSNTPSTLLRYRHISDYGLYSTAAGSGALYLLGLATGNDHQRESGFLIGESAVDSLLAVEALKFATGRQRPYQGNGSGPFHRGGASFPSEHSAIAWAIASTIAHEYPSPFVKFFSYGAATVISASRVTGKEHFPSDVLVGAAIGYLTSEYVYRHHHDENLQGESWETPAVRPEEPSHWQAKNMGSPYVSLDTWIYPAMDRLTALGYIHSGFADMRPWTRMECARQIEEAADQVEGNEEANSEATRLFNTLQAEFSAEINLLGGGDNAEFRLESVYTRVTEIAGKPLTDGDHFGQTIINDYGRPEQEGLNAISGISGWAADGPFVGYVRGEYQHSPSAAALPLSALNAISYADFGHSTVAPPYPMPTDTATPAYDEGRFLDTYAAMNFSDWQISYGNQSLWWGPSQGGPLMFSDNAAPLRMFRVNRVTPFTLPSFLSILGPIRMEAFIGQFSGYEFVLTPTGLVGQYGQFLNPQPTIHGERMSFKPTANLEIGISRTTDYGGPGYPLTVHTFLRSLLSTGNTGPGSVNKPGSRRAGLDFSYRIPGFRNGLTFYAEGLAEHDEISPLLGPDVAGWLAGIYMPNLPGILKLDLRVEGGYTAPPSSAVDVNYGAFYWDATWITGFQNDKHLMGSWIGRQGQGEQAWTTYWLSPRNKIQFGFRHQEVSRELIASGGTLADANVRTEFWLGSKFSFAASLQYETWNYPVLASARQSNVTTSIQLSLWPKSWRNKHNLVQ
jgi:membrane-associated phospholipid phosphatase